MGGNCLRDAAFAVGADRQLGVLDPAVDLNLEITSHHTDVLLLKHVN